MAFCPTCGTQIADGARCPKCAGGAVQGAVTPAATGLTDNVAGALAYVTIIPAIVFLVLEPFNRKRFVRFHAFQSIFFFIAWTILGIGMAYPFPWMGNRAAVAADQSGLVCDLADAGPQGLPGTDVQAARDRRHGRAAGRRLGRSRRLSRC